MQTSHYRFWPSGLPYSLTRPQTTLDENLEISARRYPDKPAIVFYDSVMTYAQLDRTVTAMAGYLQQACGLEVGDRVLIYSQNCPQLVIAYYAVLRAGGVVVPANPMYLAREVAELVDDSQARIALVAQELYERVVPLLDDGRLSRVIRHAYAEYQTTPTDLMLPDDVTADVEPVNVAGVTSWNEALNDGYSPAATGAGPDSWAVLGYTSGTTGRPKGCLHTHATVMAACSGSALWRDTKPSDVNLAVAPLFHFLGMQGGMNVPIYVGSTMVLMQRWDREVALTLIERYRVTCWSAPPAMITDFFAQPAVEDADISSLYLLMGGGAAMPEAVARRLYDDYGIVFNEAYGMTETAAFVLGNPVQRGKRQCLGVPTFDVDARIIDCDTLAPVAPGEPGELILHGPQVMLSYWHAPEANAESFMNVDGKRFLRTGDLALIDEDGYFCMVDRLKRMINASGFKVWPTEVESILYKHEAVQEACVVGIADPRRGETPVAALVLKPGHEAGNGADAVREWCRSRMAAYKVPTRVEFVDALPRSGTGKIQWKDVQTRMAERLAS